MKLSPQFVPYLGLTFIAFAIWVGIYVINGTLKRIAAALEKKQ